MSLEVTVERMGKKRGTYRVWVGKPKENVNLENLAVDGTI
jgi:hypothetical protein